MAKKALIVIDIQYDFIKGGALAVPKGENIIPIVNHLMDNFDLVVATQDWHLANHGSFAANHTNKEVGQMGELGGLPQVMWPVHCVQGSKGADFVAQLNTKRFKKVFQKGTDPQIDSYSGFFDNGHQKSTGLSKYLKAEGVEEVYIVGLAADYCVKFTALDAIGEGFETYLYTDATKGVNLSASDTKKAFAELKEKGAHLIESA